MSAAGIEVYQIRVPGTATVLTLETEEAAVAEYETRVKRGQRVEIWVGLFNDERGPHDFQLSESHEPEPPDEPQPWPTEDEDMERMRGIEP